MFNSPILDVAITLSFTYFMLSLMVSAFNEFVYSLFSKRGNMLKQAICDLLFDTGEWKTFVTDKIYASPQIKSLQKNADKFPSYIPAKNFAIAVIDSMRKDNQLMDMDTIRTALLDSTNTVLPVELKKALLPMFERAQGDLEKFQSQIETFYNTAMDRVTGWYKRETGKVIFAIALAVCAICNIDSINIVKKLWSDPNLSAKTDKIAGIAKNMKYDTAAKTFNLDSTITGVSSSYEVTQFDSATSTQKKISVNLDNAAGAAKTLASTGIPYGWPGNGIDGTCWHWVLSLLIKIGGWLITAFAVMLGAPFWFDLMNKFINLRGSGKKPDDGTKKSNA
ncbi:MAG TPA: hypothetical protein VG738_20675 [Chitinophagaceae bacterium]|nr:hypothetical protein [Chitinophagaceae bacterium]